MNNTELTLHQLSEIAGGPHIRTWSGTRMYEKQVEGIICGDWVPSMYSFKPVAFSPSVVGR